MPRSSRCVFANIPHHITQRGNRREDVFFNEEDRKIFLDLLKKYSEKYFVKVIAYCLMTNHIHLILVPTTEDGLEKVLRPLHMRYAQKINKNKGWQGHLWQGRYFSSPLDEDYLWECIRYIENNPVRAKMVNKAEEYKWSSARYHCRLDVSELFSNEKEWLDKIKSINNWSKWLTEKEDNMKLEIIRRNIEKGLPCGSEKFINQLEKIKNKILKYRPIGRPQKNIP